MSRKRPKEKNSNRRVLYSSVELFIEQVLDSGGSDDSEQLDLPKSTIFLGILSIGAIVVSLLRDRSDVEAIEEVTPENIKLKPLLFEGPLGEYKKGISSSQVAYFEGAEHSKWSGDIQGMQFSSKRTREYFNLGNVRPSSTPAAGQIGVEKAYRGEKSIGKFIIFADPYYAVEAVANRTIARRSATESFWQADLSEAYPKEYAILKRRGNPIPNKGKNLYRVIFHYAPPSDSNDTYKYATQFLRTGVWKSINDPLDLSDRNQFIAFFRTIFRFEQGTVVEPWYLSACYDAIYLNGAPPLQEYLANSAVKEEAISVFNNGSGSYNYKY